MEMLEPLIKDWEIKRDNGKEIMPILIENLKGINKKIL